MASHESDYRRYLKDPTAVVPRTTQWRYRMLRIAAYLKGPSTEAQGNLLYQPPLDSPPVDAIYIPPVDLTMIHDNQTEGELNLMTHTYVSR